ncbi:MAG: hypothetical protein JXR78_06790, partial [Victivallales bacterium]|nr:hypothetical protein [Victivallales bacterium]
MTNLRAVIATINGKVRGWAEYFKIGNSYNTACKLDRYLWEQLRLYWRKCKHRKNIQGTRRWENAYFYEQGLFLRTRLVVHAGTHPNKREMNKCYHMNFK